MKKWLSFALALVMALALCSVSWADDETNGTLNIVYVNTESGDDTRDGTSSEKAVRSLKQAMKLVEEGGTVKVEGQTTANPFWGDQNRDDKTIAGGHYYVTKSVTIEGTGTGMKDINGIALPSNFNGKLTLRNIDFDGTAAIGIYEGGIGNQAELVIENCRFNKASGNCVYIVPQIASLTIKDCNFTAVESRKDDGTPAKQYLIWPYAAKNVTIVGNTIDGQSKAGIRGAIHLGDGHPEGTTATITGNTIENIERGVQLAFVNGTNHTVEITGNNFTNIARASETLAGEKEYGAVFIHSVQKDNARVTLGNNTLSNVEQEIYTENQTVPVENLISAPTGSELVKNNDGTYSVKPAEQEPVVEQPKYYYKNPATTTDDTTKGSPKTFDAGVGVYAVTAVLSLGGMAWTAKKRH